MKRQALQVTTGKLYRLIEELEEEFPTDEEGNQILDEERKFLIGIINKTPECSDTWEIE